MKNRFRFFKNPVTLQEQSDVDNAFVTACIVHNMILKFDGLDRLWEADVNWERLNPNSDDDEDDEDEPADETFLNITVHDPSTFVPTYVEDLIPLDEVRDFSYDKQGFELMRSYLANHLHLTYKCGELRWPLTRKEIDDRHNRLPREHFQNTGDL